MPCRKELEREARIILQTMLKRRHFIKKLPYDEMALYDEQTEPARFVRKLPFMLIDFMQENEWLKFKDNAYHHTEAGQIWLEDFIYFVDLDQGNTSKRQTNKTINRNNQPRPMGLNDFTSIANQDASADHAPLLKLYNRQRNIAYKYLSEIHLQAGQRLFELFVKANLRPNVTMNWENLQSVKQSHHTGVKDMSFSEATYIARRELHESLSQVGQDFSAILVEICLFGNGLEATEKALNWPARSAKLLLTMALDRLATHYQLTPNEAVGNKYLAWLAVDMNTDTKF
ncbi:MAG: hypothetical protein COB24_00475 [Hyphomicrobiales bacterium]|nr:MAG: hypothetical protein COB24_00475 [Hyphomicrobiales bacterium]